MNEALRPWTFPAMNAHAQPRIVVLIPCYNEASAIGNVVDAFRTALPEAQIFVYDNNSTDETIADASL